MRYHWGLGVGHLHAHQHASTFPEDNFHWQNFGSSHEALETLEDANDDNTRIQDVNHDADADAEFSLEDPDRDEWEDIDSEDEEGDGDEDMDSEEEDFTGM